MLDILVSIAWSTYLMPYQCQVITSTNPDLIPMKPQLARWNHSEINSIMQTTFQMDFSWVETCELELILD